jgi:hypothetical protein
VVVHLEDLGALVLGVLSKRGVQERPAGRRIELWCNERPAPPEWRGQEFFDRTDAFGDEEAISLTSAATLQIAC